MHSLDAMSVRGPVFRLKAAVEQYEREALAVSEARYRASFENAGVGLAHVGLDGRFLRVNQRLCAMTGYKREDLLGRRFQEITHSDDLPDNLARMRMLLDGELSTYIMEKRYRRADGTTVWVKLTASLLRDPTGRPEHFISVMDDITDRKDAEARLRLGLDTAGLGIGEWDFARGRFRVDERISALSGGMLPPNTWLSPESPERAAWLALMHPDDMAAHEADRRALAEGRPGKHVLEYRVRVPGDGWHWIARATALLETDPTGRALRAIDALQDVTERKQGEQRLRHALDGLPQIAWLTRSDGTGLYYNRRLLEYAGGDPGPSFADRMSLVHPDDALRVVALSHSARANNTEFDAEARLRRHDGTWRWHRLHAVALDEADAPDGGGLSVATAVDVHDIKEAERVLAEANAELERRVADRTRALTDAARELAAEMRRREDAQEALLQAQKLEALGQLTGGVAHDLNNVLAAVSGSYELIRRRTDDAALLRLVRLGEQGAERAAALVRQLLAFARRETLKPALIDPASLLAQVESLARHAVGAQVACVLEVEDGIWPVLADPQRLEMALLNLAVNARDAMPEGGRLTIGAHNIPDSPDWPGGPNRGESVAITVSDTGTGMSPEVLARAAEPFFTTKGRGKGTGLGLATTRGFAEQSGGTLRIDSRLGAGTSVTILLPRARAEVAGTPAPALDASAGEPAGDAVVLLVDDDEQGRPVTAALLRDMGYTVIEAANAEGAFALAHAPPAIDVLVSDVIMPGADGPTLAARLRAERPSLPVVFITGHAGAHALEAETVLAKPFAARELGVCVARALGRDLALL